MNVPNDDSPERRRPIKVAIAGSSGLIGTALISASGVNYYGESDTATSVR